ncbi:MAG TPA: hypothetical protein VGX48_22770 [Pyrinomonadaceae bacterium]|nr:hypothetical protein [Pyrinomonadaceae bacterium]
MRTALRKNVGLALVVGLIVMAGGLAAAIRGAGAAVVVPAGYDTFVTPDDARTFDDFSSHPVPAGFFGNGSLAYTGRATLKGGPPVDSTQFGSADTVIKRNNSVTVPGDTSLSVTGLSFVSAAPITVQFSDGHTESWNVTVGASNTTGSAGTMHFNSDGTFTSSLSIYPKYTFTRYGAAARTLDTGSGGGAAPINLSSTNGTWSQSGSVTVINPGSEDSILASHGVKPAPTPCPTATVQPADGTASRQNVSSARAICASTETTTLQPQP